MMGLASTGNVTWNSHEIHKLVEFVRQKDCLYATECPDYNNRDVVWGHWSEIGKILNKPAVACRDKWTNLRGVYRRLVMSSPYQRLPVRNKTRKTWSWEPYMAFLKPHLHHRKSTMRSLVGHEVDTQSFGILEVAQAQGHGQPTVTATPGPGYLQGLQASLQRADAHRYDAEDQFLGQHQQHQVNQVPDVDADDDTTFDSTSPTGTVLGDASATSEIAGSGGMVPGGGGPGPEGKHYSTSQGPGGLSAASGKTEAVDEFFRYLQTPAGAPTKSGNKTTHGGSKSSDEGNNSNAGLTTDPDELFFKSIIPDVKLLSPRDKGAFKLRVLQMLQMMLYPKNELDVVDREASV